MDDVDRAAEWHELWLSSRLERRRSDRAAETAGAETCLDCGERVPQARRDLVKGATRCVPCQARLERLR